MGWLLEWGNYVAGATVQAREAILSMKLLVGGIPAICGLVGIFVAFLFDIENK